MKTNTRVRRDSSKKAAIPQAPNKPTAARQCRKPGRWLTPKEFKVVALRDCLLPDDMPLCDNPQYAADYWRCNIANHPQFNPERECLVVLILNTRRRAKGHVLETIGTRDTLLVDTASVFRTAVIQDASAIILMHNHPSGVATPSEADIKVTRDLIRAGQLLRVQVLDHVVIGQPMESNPMGYQSLKELGYFYA